MDGDARDAGGSLGVDSAMDMRSFAFLLISLIVVLVGAPVALADRLRQGFGESAVASAKADAQKEGSERRRAIAPPGVKPVGPYSPGILAGDFLYVSGQGGRDPAGTLPATIEGQARQTLQNVKAIVEAAGLTMEHVVYSQVYLVDIAHHDAMDRVWKEFFSNAPPARAVLGVHRLPTDIAVEINAVAFRDRARTRRIVPAAYPRNLSWSPGVMAGNRLFLSGSSARTSRRAEFHRTLTPRFNSRSTT